MNILNKSIFSDFVFLENFFKSLDTADLQCKSSDEIKPLLQSYIDKNNTINPECLKIKEVHRRDDNNFNLLLKSNTTDQYIIDKFEISYMPGQNIKVRAIGYSCENNYLDIEFLTGAILFNIVNFSCYEYLKISLYTTKNPVKYISHPNEVLNVFMNDATTNKDIITLMEKLLNIETVAVEEKELDCLKYDTSIENSCFYGTLIKKESEVTKKCNKSIKEATPNDSRSKAIIF